MKTINQIAIGDSVTGREIALCMANDGEFYRTITCPVIANLQKHIAKGVYDKSKALISWRRAAVLAMKKYAKDNSLDYSLLGVGGDVATVIALEFNDYYQEHLFPMS